ncbi:MAG TPA: hypothetical protein ENL08_04365, partial [Bacteroidetes bacterium]|nr:hypothetical protein [Bacteroidota bacterium]
MSNKTNTIAGLMVLWGLLASLQFFMFGDNSYIRSFDNGDANHPKTYASLHFPNLSHNHAWRHYDMCGIDGGKRSYRRSAYQVLQALFPGWGGYAILMILQRVFAAVFMFLLARRTLGLGLTASLSAGMLYPFLIAQAPLGIYHSLGEPCLPFYLFTFNELLRTGRIWIQIIGGLALGIVFSQFSSLFVSQPFLVAGILAFLLFVQRIPLVKILPAALACLVGLVIFNLPSILNTWEIKDSTQRMLLISAKKERTLFSTLRFTFADLVMIFRHDGVPLLACLAGISVGAHKLKLFRSTFWTFVLFGVFSTFVPYILSALAGIDFFKAYNIRRFYYEYPFFLYLAAGISVQYIASELGTEDYPRWRERLKYILVLCLLLLAMALLSVRFYSAFRSIQVRNGYDAGLLGSKGGAQALTILFFLITTGFIAISTFIKRQELGRWLRILVLVLLPFYAGFYLVERLSTNLSDNERYRALYEKPEYRLVAAEIAKDPPCRVATAYTGRLLHPTYALVAGLETVD